MGHLLHPSRRRGPTRRDLPDAELVRLDVGHFALEGCLDEISHSIRTFYDTGVAAVRQPVWA